MAPRYSVQIRTYTGAVVAAGNGRGDWRRTATRLAARVGHCGRSDTLALDIHYDTHAGAPWGTHHVRWGHTPRGGHELSLGPAYLVAIAPV